MKKSSKSAPSCHRNKPAMAKKKAKTSKKRSKGY